MADHLPKQHEAYNLKVYKRCLEKIKTTNCWVGISIPTLNNWLTNFETEEEKFLAHRVLDLLIYRSEPHIHSLLKSLFYQTVPSVLYRNGYDLVRIRELIQGLAKWRGQLKIVLNVDNNDLTGSATELGRRIKTLFRVDESNLIGLSKVKRLPDSCVFIVIDDFCGTGNQITKAISQKMAGTNKEVYLCPLITHSKAKTKISDDLISKSIVRDLETAETIDEKYNIFSPESKSFKWNGRSFHNEYKGIYESLLDRKLPGISDKFKYGYEEQSLIFSFHYRCPNNCVPIIWYTNDGWSPLIRH